MKKINTQGRGRSYKIETAFGIGIECESNSFGMCHGPFLTLKEALEIVPEDKSVIIRFNRNGTEDILYFWDDNCWNVKSRKEKL